MADIRELDPLRHNDVIVDREGHPMVHFIRQWNALIAVSKAAGILQLSSEELTELIALLQQAASLLDDRITEAETDVTALELRATNLEAAAVGPGGATGEVWTKQSGTDYDADWEALPAGSGGIYTVAEASGDVDMTADNTPVDVPGATLSLVAGTYEILGAFQFYKPATGRTQWQAMITDGAGTIVYRTGGVITDSSNPQGAHVMLVHPKLILASTTAVKLRAQVFEGSSATNTSVLQNFNSSPATYLAAKQVA